MIFKHFLLWCSICVLAACGGGGGSVSEGMTVAFQLTRQQSVDATGNYFSAPAGQKTFKTREGIVVTLKQAYLVVWSVTLESDCNDVNFAFPWFHWLSPAVAHTDDTPTLLGVPHVINILADDAEVANLGSIYPPPAAYCGITVELLKADDDAVGLLDFPINMLNRVLYLEGEYTPLGSTDPVAFTLDVAKTPRPKRLRLTTPLILSESAPSATIRFATQYDRWFDAVNFFQLNQDSQIDWVLNNITESFKIQSF